MCCQSNIELFIVFDAANDKTPNDIFTANIKLNQRYLDKKQQQQQNRKTRYKKKTKKINKMKND